MMMTDRKRTNNYLLLQPLNINFMFQSHLVSAAFILQTLTLISQHFSDTYCTAVMQGGYEGFDPSFITSIGMFSPADSHSLLWDSFTIAARYARCHACSFVTQGSKYIVDRKLMHAKKQNPSPLELSETRTSTFIDIESAIWLQEKI
jgi:hypothetical protein